MTAGWLRGQDFGRNLWEGSPVIVLSWGGATISSRSTMFWQIIVRGVRSDDFACTWCGSRYVRASRLRSPRLLKLLGLRFIRCESCLRLFALSRRFRLQLLSESDGSPV
jgi:hypothetical protein